MLLRDVLAGGGVSFVMLWIDSFVLQTPPRRTAATGRPAIGSRITTTPLVFTGSICSLLKGYNSITAIVVVELITSIVSAVTLQCLARVKLIGRSNRFDILLPLPSLADGGSERGRPDERGPLFVQVTGDNYSQQNNRWSYHTAINQSTQSWRVARWLPVCWWVNRTAVQKQSRMRQPRFQRGCTKHLE